MAIILMAIGDYCIVNYCLIFYVIISQAIGSYYIVGYLKLFFIGYYFYSKLFLPWVIIYIQIILSYYTQDKIIYNKIKQNDLE